MTMTLRERLRGKRHDPLVWWSIAVVLVWRYTLGILNQLVSQWRHGDVLHQWANWDGGWFLHVIKNGYHYNTFGSSGVGENVSYFPGFPLLVHTLHNVFQLGHLAAGLLVNIALTIGAVYFCMKLAELVALRREMNNPERLAILAGIALLVFPSSFFMAAFYAEALLVFSVLGAIYFAQTQRLAWAVGFAALASLSGFIGIIAVPVIMVMVYEQWRAQARNALTLLQRWAFTLLGSGGLLIFVYYLAACFKDGLAFTRMSAPWGRNGADEPFVTGLMHNYYGNAFNPQHFGSKYSFMLGIFVMVLPVILIAMGLIARKVYDRWWPIVLVAGLLVIPLGAGTLDSLNRYALLAAPLLPGVIFYLYQRVRAAEVYALFALSGALMLFFAYGFLSGHYFAG